MNFRAEELAVINMALSINNGQVRQFSIQELPDITEIAKMLKASTEDKETEQGVMKVFIDVELKFTAAQSVFISGLIAEAKWEAGQGEVVLSVLEKLK